MNRKKRANIVTGILVLCAAAAALWGVLAARGGEPQEGAAPGNDTTVLALAEPADDSYLQDTLFIGDSRTLGLALYGFVDEARVVAYDGLNHKAARTKQFADLRNGGKGTIAQAVREQKPARMIVAFGINGMAFMSEDAFMEEYKGLVRDLRAASPESTLILQSIYPVSKEQEKLVPAASNEAIDRYNRKLLNLAREEQLYFLDTAELLKADDGSLDPLYDAGDGLHVGAKAYEAILGYVLAHPAPWRRD